MKTSESRFIVVPIETETTSYDIVIGHGVLDDAQTYSSLPLPPKRTCIISDRTVFGYYGDRLTTALENKGFRCVAPFIMSPGEKYKTFRTIEKCCRHLAQVKLDRDGLIVTLGGGVPGDLGGFASAIYKRGVDFIQVPTSLLAQVDASIGGKTGVNLPEGKNLVGAFHQPRSVIIDPATLSTLPLKQKKNGIAEIIKTAVLSGEDFLKQVEQVGNTLLKNPSVSMIRIIERACRFKADIVSKDEKEKNIRLILNLGHTIGHALECALGYRIMHGEAVSLGLVVALHISNRMELATRDFKKRIETLLKTYGLPVKAPASIAPDAIEKALNTDKKRSSGLIRFILPVEPGTAVIRDDVPMELIRSALDEVLYA